MFSTILCFVFCLIFASFLKPTSSNDAARAKTWITSTEIDMYKEIDARHLGLYPCAQSMCTGLRGLHQSFVKVPSTSASVH